VTFTCDCIQGYYDDGSNSLCLPCSYTCATCSGPQNYNCITCVSFYNRILIPAINFNGYLCSCSFGYIDKGTSACAQINCDITCMSCKDTSNIGCLSCPLSRTLTLSSPISISGICKCSIGYY
jgi:hypothetical protein